MGLKIPISHSFNLPDGRTVTLETGKLATQADGSCLVRLDKTMILATVVSNLEAKADQSFFPLSVDYQEKFAAAGRIPGNFFRREGKLSDYEVLVSRLIDRAIRPMFADEYLNETQIMVSLISGDKETMPDALAALAASTALSVSDIPFLGPISEVRVARINGEYVINPNRSALAEADMDFIVSASMNDINMVEGEAKECSESDMLEAIKIAHEAIRVQCQAQLDLAKMVGAKCATKRTVVPAEEDEHLKVKVEYFCKSKILEVARGAMDKTARKKRFKEIKEELVAELTAEFSTLSAQEGAVGTVIDYVKDKPALIERYYDKLKKKLVRSVVISDKIRLDGRALTEVRPIWTEIDYLPSAHGSAIFNRGETQALASLTLGTKLDEMMSDTALLMSYEKFILHYNFPAFSVGEVKPSRGPGRREVGHANLAARSLKQTLPTGFPYTMRIVSDVLESNGSSSMATVCAGSLALMDAGVPVKAPCAGIAMGLIQEGDKYAILTDILGDEDALGDMDFKVTGTEKGIIGCQMDIKIDGLSYDMLEEALAQAKDGRLHILSKMAESISKPNEDLKPYAPRIVEVRIDKEFIGAVIGPQGKIIQEIQRESGTTITIEEVGSEGIVNIFGPNKEALDKALARVKMIAFTPIVGDTYDAVVVSLQPYGAFVDFNGKSGLLHISEISHSRIDNVEDALKEGDKIKVKLIEIDRKTGKMRLSRKALLPVPPRPPRPERNDPAK